jgi:hypothetical protein
VALPMLVLGFVVDVVGRHQFVAAELKAAAGS